MPRYNDESERRIAEAQKMLEERAQLRAERRAIKEAENKAFWDEYKAQLAKSSASGGGAKRRRATARPFRWN